MVDMLRKTSSGTYERQDANGAWVPVTASEALAASSGVVSPEPEVDQADVATMLDTLVDELNGKDHDTGLPISSEPVIALAADIPITPEMAQAAQAAFDAAMAETPATAGDFDLEVPGLVSSDSGRGTKGFKTVRERLKENARKRREPKKVEVGAAAARVVGPAKVEGTERRQQRKATERLEAGKSAGVSTVDGGVRQRYVNRPAPALFEGRPRWVQDLFEAHFRSEHTLGMRRAFNRMKISRQDYAIGWLTAFDKFREETALLRAKSGD